MLVTKVTLGLTVGLLAAAIEQISKQRRHKRGPSSFLPN